MEFGVSWENLNLELRKRKLRPAYLMELLSLALADSGIPKQGEIIIVSGTACVVGGKWRWSPAIQRLEKERELELIDLSLDNWKPIAKVLAVRE